MLVTGTDTIALAPVVWLIYPALTEPLRLLPGRTFFEEEAALVFIPEPMTVVLDLIIVDCLSTPSSSKSFDRSRAFYCTDTSHS